MSTKTQIFGVCSICLRPGNIYRRSKQCGRCRQVKHDPSPAEIARMCKIIQEERALAGPAKGGEALDEHRRNRMPTIYKTPKVR